MTWTQSAGGMVDSFIGGAPRFGGLRYLSGTITQRLALHSACEGSAAQPSGGHISGGLALQSARSRASELVLAGVHTQPGQHTSEPGIPGMNASQSLLVPHFVSRDGLGCGLLGTDGADEGVAATVDVGGAVGAVEGRAAAECVVSTGAAAWDVGCGGSSSVGSVGAAGVGVQAGATAAMATRKRRFTSPA